ncbi:hypothetical protein ACRAWF_46330 [Streptomyces sp. L7]
MARQAFHEARRCITRTRASSTSADDEAISRGSERRAIEQGADAWIGVRVTESTYGGELCCLRTTTPRSGHDRRHRGGAVAGAWLPQAPACLDAPCR